MKIKTIHAHFLISTGNYSNERIGFSVNLDDGETAEEVVPILRERAKKIVGEKADDLYEKRNKLHRDCIQFEDRLDKLRKEWDATAAFLKAQGLNPDAPSMPQFRNLLSAVTVESEVVSDDEDDEEEDNYDEDDEDYN
ncbi:hypothetical protein [Halotia branconii]|uniref:Uncharacterized protein n=1 Tax=Halotia branconii CENA392 TaxID=1539056 RepID=A0AAJ6NSG5_9CYAN|nr:hypothetical protein [Halotia branconii]WGV25686.1 hypothetical protein QI031_28865 [Halotia branconii CENA392]